MLFAFSQDPRPSAEKYFVNGKPIDLDVRSLSADILEDLAIHSFV